MLEKFIKNYNDREDPQVRIRVGRFAGFVGIVANVTLFAIKLAFGLVFGSISIVADSLNNLSDSGSNVLTVVGYTISGKPADKDHPYGHGRVEYISALGVSFFVLLMGIELFKSSVENRFRANC